MGERPLITDLIINTGLSYFLLLCVLLLEPLPPLTGTHIPHPDMTTFISFIFRFWRYHSAPTRSQCRCTSSWTFSGKPNILWTIWSFPHFIHVLFTCISSRVTFPFQSLLGLQRGSRSLRVTHVIVSKPSIHSPHRISTRNASYLCSYRFCYKEVLCSISLSLSLSLVAKSCPTLASTWDCSPPSSSVHGILQARILEWVAISFSRGSSQPRDRTRVSYTAGRCFTDWATRGAPV